MLKTATHHLDHIAPRILQIQRSIRPVKLDGLSYLFPTRGHHLSHQCLRIRRRDRNMEEPAMVIIKCRWFLELGIRELEDLKPDAIACAQPRRLDLLQAVGVDLDHRRGGRFRTLGKTNRAQFAET